MSDGNRPLEPVLIIPPDHPASPASRPPDRLQRFHRLAWWLFGATILSTFIAGAWFHGGFLNGAAYSATIMSILLAHEMGHYLQALRYRVPATPPLFIPMPISPVGTMGAVIVQGAGYADRRILFDIAVTGPLAGLVVAVPAVAWGAQFLETRPVSPGNMIFADPLLVKAILRVVHGPTPAGTDFFLDGLPGAVFFAGWFGVLITGLNLIPLGQLDGGHVLYSLIGVRQHLVARLLFLGATAWVVASFVTGASIGWLPMLILVALMGIKHPPTRDDRVALGTVRYAVGWFTLALLLVFFVPVPIYEAPAEPVAAAPARQNPDGPVRQPSEPEPAPLPAKTSSPSPTSE